MSIKRSRNFPSTHPGTVFKRRVLDRHEISIKEAAEKLHVTRAHLSRFVNGNVGVKVDFALRLEKASGISAQFWMNLQQAYDLHMKRDEVIDCEELYEYA
ncbi:MULTISPECIES: HigA family addiction module antitoxin [Salinimonas]|uniref:HigA family addiction module antidote protein n=2 Tax=Salinimonas TaxID=288793 RepID=A0A5B7YJ62_9ALTE|nr:MULTISPECIES: HigA family addiction module antitoxin [Salinimonas]MBD3587541.1 HigA family addiction module antidote protein [Salinimonas profundi]QCZ95545.1 HigA family addiction module antidote protein [Salinimonas iocasae]